MHYHAELPSDTNRQSIETVKASTQEYHNAAMAWHSYKDVYRRETWQLSSGVCVWRTYPAMWPWTGVQNTVTTKLVQHWTEQIYDSGKQKH